MRNENTEFIGLGRLATALGKPRRSLLEWVRRGYIRPARVAAGCRSNCLLNPVDCLSYVVGHELQRNRFSMAEIALVTNWLRTRTIDGLQADWADGRHVMFVVAGCAPCPRLLKRGDIFDNPAIDFDAARKVGVHAVGVDLESAWRQLQSKLADAEPTNNGAGLPTERAAQ
jgi:hypothetical protein